MSVIVQHMPVELLRHPETTSQTSPVRCAILTKGAPESIKVGIKNKKKKIVQYISKS